TAHARRAREPGTQETDPEIPDSASSLHAVEEHLQRNLDTEERLEDLERRGLEERLLAASLDHPLGLHHLRDGLLPRGGRTGVDARPFARQVHNVRWAHVLSDVIDNTDPAVESTAGDVARHPRSKIVRRVAGRKDPDDAPGMIENVQVGRKEQEVEVL